MTIAPEIPKSLLDEMAEIGPRWALDTRGHIKMMIERFSALLAGTSNEGVEVRENIAYGAHERQRFELFLPLRGPGRRPALIFVHGGGFTEGSRNRTKEVHSNVLHYFARAGIVGVNAGYRLAPEARYPKSTRDVAQVVSWVKEHADELGADPSRIFLMGHSAGGAHVASYAYDKRHHPIGGPGLAGLIVVSGRVRADNAADNPNAARVATYYGSDAGVYEDVSPVTHVGPDSPPTFIALAEFENPLIDVYCLELAYRLAAAKRKGPQLLWLKGHNHMSIIAHMNTAEDRLGKAILSFIEAPT